MATDIECPQCDGEGWTLTRAPMLGSGFYELDCDDCCGTGFREMTPDEEAEAAERQYHDRYCGEPPISVQEAYERAYIQQRTLNHG